MLERDHLPIEGDDQTLEVKEFSDADLNLKVENEVLKNVDEIHKLWQGEPKAKVFSALSSVQVAMPILFLASSDASGLTGVELPVDGGFSIKGVCFVKEGSSAAACETICE